MKYIAITLAFYLSILTIAPIISMSCSQDTEMCSSNCHKKDNKAQTSNCPFGICCANCLFFNSEEKPLEIIKLATVVQKIGTTDERVYSNYCSDTWHPPEIV